MKTFSFKVVKYQRPPAQLHHKSGRSQWRDLFESMDVGHWFLVDKTDYARTQQACSNYMRGRYSLYRHPTKPATYVCVKNK